MDRINFRPQLRSAWQIVSGRELRRNVRTRLNDIRGTLSERLPVLFGLQPALPGVPNIFAEGLTLGSRIEESKISTMQMAGGAAGTASRPSLPPSKMTTPPPLPKDPNAQNGKPGRGRKIITGVLYGLAGAAALAGVFSPVTNLAFMIAPIAIMKLSWASATAAVGVCALVNLVPVGLIGLAHLLISRRNKTAKINEQKKNEQPSAPLTQPRAAASEVPLETMAADINRVEGLSFDLSQVRPEDLRFAYRELATIKEHLKSQVLRGNTPLRVRAEAAKEALSRAIMELSRNLGLVFKTGGGDKSSMPEPSEETEYFILPVLAKAEAAQSQDISLSFAAGHLIGSGGFGEVYKAVRDPAEDIFFAVKAEKKMDEQVRQATQAERRARLERRIATMIRHGNIVKYFGGGKLADGREVVVMEFLTGEPLKDVLENLKKGTRVGYEQAVDWLLQTIEGLHEAHNFTNPETGEPLPIAHRDIKLENLFLTEESDKEIIKILDFGMVKVISDDISQSDQTRTGQLMGTASYLAPENLIYSLVQTSDRLSARERADWLIRQDVYALGCVFYRLLTSNSARPYGIDSQETYLNNAIYDTSGLINEFKAGQISLNELISRAAAKRGQPPRLEQHNIPENLFSIVERMLWFNPLERYQNVAAIAADLRQVKDQLNGRAPSSAAHDPTRLSHTPAEPIEAAQQGEETRAAKSRSGQPAAPANPTEELDFTDLELESSGDISPLEQIIARLNNPESRREVFDEINLGIIPELSAEEMVSLEDRIADISNQARRANDQELYTQAQYAMNIVFSLRQDNGSQG
ncbi:MAG: serine/threonine protein kinase [Candidatus Saganbacteria bacterium]|nr:serine/threonine protein kinase [Candidatus Saganbacteria bacterium]